MMIKLQPAGNCRWRTAELAAAMLVAILLPSPLSAQSVAIGNAASPPEAPFYDRNFVQMPSGFVVVEIPQLTVGGLEQRLSNFATGLNEPLTPVCGNCYDRDRHSGFYRTSPIDSSLAGGITFGSSPIDATFKFGSVSERFKAVSSGGTLVPGDSLSKSGGSIVQNPGGLSYTYTDRNGVQYLLDCSVPISAVNPPHYDWPVTKVTYPNGDIITIAFKTETAGKRARIQGASSNRGFFIKFEYLANSPANPTDQDWLWPKTVKGGNLAFDYCDITADACALSSARTATNSWSADARTLTIGNAAGETTRFTQTQYYEISAIKPSISDIDTITYSYCSRTTTGTCSWGGGTEPNHVYPGVVKTAVHGSSTNYGPSLPNLQAPLIHTDAQDNYRGTRTLTQLTNPDPYANGRLYQYTHYDGRSWLFINTWNRVSEYADGTGRKLAFAYDARNNIISVTDTPAGGGTALVTFYTYPPTCGNPVTCNKASAITDPRGKVIDYTYDPVHGGILTETKPAAANGVRPQKRFEYAQRYAWYKNSSGSIVQAASPIWLLVRERFCKTTAPSGQSCLGGSADEVVTDYDYGPTTGANNLLLRGVAVTADNMVRRTCYTYNAFGDRVSETSPNAALGACP